MPKEKSPYQKRIHLNELQKLRQELEKRGRVLRFYLGKKNGHIMIADGNSILGPLQNWKAKWIMEKMLEWEDKHNSVREAALKHVQTLIQNNLLFITAH